MPAVGVLTARATGGIGRAGSGGGPVRAGGSLAARSGAGSAKRDVTTK